LSFEIRIFCNGQQVRDVDCIILLTVMFPLPVHTIQSFYLYLAIFQQNLYIEYTFLDSLGRALIAGIIREWIMPFVSTS